MKLISRMWRAIKLQSALYEEVEADKTANVQAGLVIVIVSIATAIGAGLSSLTSGGFLAAVWSLVLALVGWLIWALIVYVIGAKIMKGKQTQSNWGEVARTIGFANSPGIFRILAFIPVVGWIISIVAWIWILIAGIIGVRAALDFSTGRAIITVVIGWLVYMALMIVLGLLGIGTVPLPM
ncbi:YIP1 family protein [Chloroflexota bacterium]